MHIRDFDFDLPPELIAQEPLPARDGSRMMVVFRGQGRFENRAFRDLPGFLGPGDLMVLNDARVIPAKAWGRRGDAVVEFLFVAERAPAEWEVICRPAKRVRVGDRIEFGPAFAAAVLDAGAEGGRVLRFEAPDVLSRLSEVGYAPLPPYIKRRRLDAARRPADLARYQTVFAARPGAIAAPTAGLHFTPEMLGTLDAAGVGQTRVTLNVGPATFQPVRVENLEEHRMGAESYEIPAPAARTVETAKREARPVLAVGTTVVRTLESAARAPRPDGALLAAGTGSTRLFIYPGFDFRVVDRLLTNFHLPQSTLLALVSAFAGRELVLEAYRAAVRERYRFFSYGDCMLIL